MTHTTQPATATEPTRVLIVEDHSILTQSLKLTLRLEGMDAYIADQLDEPAVLATARRVRPHLVLLDLHLGDGCNAVPMIRPLVGIGTRVLVLTGSTDHGLHGAALDAGAVSILHKGESLEQLCQDIRDVVDGRSVMRPSRRDELLTHGRHHIALESKLRSLSTREGEVLTALADGKSADAIASEQFVSIGTVRSHIRSILRKLDVGSQLAAVAAARRGGWASGLPASDRESPIL